MESTRTEGRRHDRKENATVFRRRHLWLTGSLLALAGALAGAGCYSAPPDNSEYCRGPAPLRMPSPEQPGNCACYEDSLTGGQVFDMYCSYCHYAPALAERPFSNFRNVAAHMRVRANLTGKEYEKVMAFLRRWHDVPPRHPPVQESPPKRMIFSQPISELRPKTPATGTAPQPPAGQPPAPQPAAPKQPVPQPAALQAPAPPDVAGPAQLPPPEPQP
jgi:hypothetical protein